MWEYFWFPGVENYQNMTDEERRRFWKFYLGYYVTLGVLGTIIYIVWG